LASFLEGTAALFHAQRLDALGGRFASFYGVDTANAMVVLHLIARPAHESSTKGRQIERHAFVEVVQGDAPEKRIDVIMHELAHWFFRMSPIRPTDVFFADTDVRTLPAGSIFDEAVA